MMAKAKSASKPASGLPEYKRLPIGLIQEPKLPARSTMSDAAMQELIASFREIGQIEPITVEACEDGYQIVTGHRRYLAARSCGWTEIAAMVYPAGQAHSMAMMLHENLVRESLNPAEEALFMAQVREELQLDEQGLCDTFKRSPNYVADRFALLRGDPNVFAALQRGEIRAGVAKELNRIKEDDMRAYYLDVARRTDPTQRAVHQWVNDWQIQAGLNRPQAAGAAGTPGENGGAPSPAGNGEVAGAAGAEGSPAITPPFFGCELCGGARDSYNLVTVRIHKWEWEQILKQVERAARGK